MHQLAQHQQERHLVSVATLAFDDITRCQIGTNYIKFYQRYFERTAH